jgi:uncharacterized protein YdiU (UPF0061 family)
MVVTGESFDYGPWRFLPKYDPAFTAAYFDETGLYAFGRQPRAVLNNMIRLARCLALLGDEDALLDRVRGYEQAFDEGMARATTRRFGVASRGHDEDMQLVEALFDALSGNDTGYEQFFFDHYAGRRTRPHPTFVKVLDRFTPNARTDHPYFERESPVTMRIEEMEALWAPIAERDDWSALYQSVEEIRTMGEALGNREST